MTRIRSRRLAFVVALALLPVTGCGGDDTPTRSATGGRKTAAGATEPTLLDTGTAQSPAYEAEESSLSSTLAGASASASAAQAAPGATTKGGGPGTTTPGHPATTTTAPRNPATTTTTPPVGGCPDPRGCPKYALLGGRWPRDADGIATIHYRVKTSGHTPANTTPITSEQLIAAVRASAQTWMDAVPSVRLVFDGATDEAPNSSNNIIGWGTTTAVATAETRFTPTPDGPTYTGFSVYLTPTYGFTWRPCDPAHGQPCDDDQASADLQGLLTHEWGHVLGLDHPDGQSGTEELTMYGGAHGNNGRHNVTLGLGDILGVRNLYPTNAPMPTLYRP